MREYWTRNFAEKTGTNPLFPGNVLHRHSTDRTSSADNCATQTIVSTVASPLHFCSAVRRSRADAQLLHQLVRLVDCALPSSFNHLRSYIFHTSHTLFRHLT